MFNFYLTILIFLRFIDTKVGFITTIGFYQFQIKAFPLTVETGEEIVRSVNYLLITSLKITLIDQINILQYY